MLEQRGPRSSGRASSLSSQPADVTQEILDFFWPKDELWHSRMADNNALCKRLFQTLHGPLFDKCAEGRRFCERAGSLSRDRVATCAEFGGDLFAFLCKRALFGPRGPARRGQDNRCEKASAPHAGDGIDHAMIGSPERKLPPAPVCRITQTARRDLDVGQYGGRLIFLNCKPSAARAFPASLQAGKVLEDGATKSRPQLNSKTSSRSCARPTLTRPNPDQLM